MNLNKGLVGHWTMDDRDTSDDTIYDRSGYGIHGNLINSPTTGQDGKVGESYSFDATNSQYVRSTDTVIASNNEVTISAWTYYPSQSRGAIIFAAEFEYGIWVQNGDLTYGVWTEEEGQRSTDTSPTTDQWVHYTLTYDGSTRRFYENGVEISSNTLNETLRKQDTAIDIGAIISNEWYLSGRIDDARVYIRALSGKEVRALYNMRSQRVKSNSLDRGLGIYATMDDSDTSGERLYDATPHRGSYDVPSNVQAGVDAPVGEGYRFEETESNDSIHVNDIEPFESARQDGNYSVSFWIKPVSVSGETDWPDIFRISGDNWRIEYPRDGVNYIQLYNQSENDGNLGMNRIYLNSNEWSHLVFTVKNESPESRVRTYLNGEIDEDSNYEELTPNSGDRFDINATSTPTHEISDVRCYTRVLSDSEVSRLANQRQ